MNKEAGPPRRRMCWCLGLGLPASRTARGQCLLFIRLSSYGICYSSQNGQRGRASTGPGPVPSVASHRSLTLGCLSLSLLTRRWEDLDPTLSRTWDTACRKEPSIHLLLRLWACPTGGRKEWTLTCLSVTPNWLLDFDIALTCFFSRWASCHSGMGLLFSGS